jgi:CRP/FNR family transcriptional regulator, cyclic AMP receptor protein
VTLVAVSKSLSKFDTKTSLSTINGGRRIEVFHKKKTIFTQGDKADCVFYIQQGKVKLAVVAANGKEATIGILNEGDFFGEGCLTGQPLRLCAATAMTDSSVMKIEKEGNGRSASPGADILRSVRKVSTGPEHPVRRRFR